MFTFARRRGGGLHGRSPGRPSSGLIALLGVREKMTAG
ncbi:predicted protein [Chaetomium globosum CBS 148.51]|uniref:Uncharacterized protein n=1 Tax=Chaetomium globosum (strain ATCC 6205 / CBS 148.51 / DSM 1962 / NBRC 6347 / NRRL 1970) TaxID=306901 RepID=Q2H6F6_CHAGB|nr:uncharacterized protein CHGG_05759 [Chaetomium globosum CBS 148.51]EAQ89140.1 predicted protein [Chaetomium globosum CBS 148.51]